MSIKQEQKALDELRGKHSYLMYELRHKDERYTMIFTRREGKHTLRPAVAIKLVVPQDSALGREVVAMRKAVDRKAKRKEAKKRMRKASRK